MYRWLKMLVKINKFGEEFDTTQFSPGGGIGRHKGLKIPRQ